MELRTQAAGSLIRHIAVPQAEADIFATAEFEKKVTLWSMRSRQKLAEIGTVLDFGGMRLAVVQELGFCLLAAASFEGPVNAYDLEGNILWSRRDLVGVQQLTPIPNGPEPMIGVASGDQRYRILGALDGREITKLDGIMKAYASLATANIIAVTSSRLMCLRTLLSTKLWEQPLKSFAVLHGALSCDSLAYSEATGAMHCFDLGGRRKWTLNPEKNRHFLRLAWNQTTGKWMAIDWDYENGGAKRLLEISDTGNPAMVADLGEPAETEFFATGDRLISSAGDILDVHSGQVVWNFLEREKGDIHDK